jgi:hypothetical protein
MSISLKTHEEVQHQSVIEVVTEAHSFANVKKFAINCIKLIIAEVFTA